MNVLDIFRIVDAAAPFSLQESWDRSGLLVGDPQQSVSRVLLTLDITVPVVHEAAEKGADLILAHHPVIWDPIRTISPEHPVWHLVQRNIAAICAHTNLDIADGGMNDRFGALLKTVLPLGEFAPLSLLPGGRVLGKCAFLSAPADADTLAVTLQSLLHCRSLRYAPGKNAESIRKIAWCTGAGGDMLGDAQAAGADALITGDCKHSVWAEAQNRGLTLFDCGHFETEVLAADLFADMLAKAAPGLACIRSEIGTRPFFRVPELKTDQPASDSD